MGHIAKAITAFLTSLVALIAALGFDSVTGWATPGLIEAVGAVLGALATAFMTWLIPNKPPVQ